MSDSYALVLEALELAYRHLDTYGCVESRIPNDPIIPSQERFFEAYHRAKAALKAQTKPPAVNLPKLGHCAITSCNIPALNEDKLCWAHGMESTTRLPKPSEPELPMAAAARAIREKRLVNADGTSPYIKEPTPSSVPEHHACPVCGTLGPAPHRANCGELFEAKHTQPAQSGLCRHLGKKAYCEMPSGHSGMHIGNGYSWSKEPAPSAELHDCREHLTEHFLSWRGVDEACAKCLGAGCRPYPSGSGWRGGISGQVITTDVCDSCWGTGDKNRKGADLRAMRSWLPPDEVERRVAAERERCALAAERFLRSDLPSDNLVNQATREIVIAIRAPAKR